MFKDLFQGNDREAQYKIFADSFKTGHDPIHGQNITFSDAMSVPNASVWLPRVISEVAREAVEPNLLLTNLLDRVQYQPGLQIINGGTGSLVAADIAEGQEYPETQLQIGGNSVVATVGKSGVAFKMTKEMKDNSQFDIMGLHIQAAGRALARHKEQKVADHLSALGVQVFDNAAPASSLLGVTHGRDESGAANGSMTWDDMFDMFGVVINNGFMPDLMIIHPLTWIMFMKDPVLRSFALAAGGGTWWGSWTGRPNGRAPWDTPKTHQSTGQEVVPGKTGIEGFPQAGMLNSAPQIPGYFLPFSLRIIVTPFVYYDPVAKISDIILADSSELGALVVQEDVMIDQWEDPSVDITKVKLRERYSIYVYNEGLGIAVAKNIKVEPNAIVLPARAQLDASALPAIPAFTAVC